MNYGDTNAATLLAGAARWDITPEMGIQLAGDIGRYRPVEEIRDRLYANALVVECGGRRICLLSLDLLATTTSWSNRIREGVAKRFGLGVEDVVVHATQNHSAPSLGHAFVSDECKLFPPEYPWLRGGDDRYHEPAVEKCVAAVGAAIERLGPVTLRVGRGIDGRVAFNRRFVMRDGTARTHPPSCDAAILHAEGPVDPEVGVATFTNREGRVVSALLHCTCHPTHGYPTRYVIGDWPGAWAELMRAHWGDQCVPLVINGCCGNIHHANHLDPNPPNDYRRMARLLTETTIRALGSLCEQPVKNIQTARRVLRLPLRALTADEIAEARRLLHAHPEPKWVDEARTRVDWDWIYAVMLLDLQATRERDPLCDYEIQTIRLGDFALVTLMGEPFVEAQLEIKLKSPAPWTFVAHFCNGYAGYVPTACAFQGGGYETRTSNGSKWQPDALEKITAESLQLLRGRFEHDSRKH